MILRTGRDGSNRTRGSRAISLPVSPPEITYTDDLLQAYGDARYALGHLSTLHDDIENENLLIAPFVVREAAMSSQIEGTDVTVSDIVLHDLEDDPERSAANLRDIREAYNYVEAIRTGFDALVLCPI